MKWCIETFRDNEDCENLHEYAEYKLVEFLNKWDITIWKMISNERRVIKIAYYIDENIYPKSTGI